MKCEYEDVCVSICVHQREMSKRNRFIKVMTEMSFYFRKLPSNAPLQVRPLISICPFHLKPSVSFSPSVLRESTWTWGTNEQGNKNYYLTCLSLCLCVWFLLVLLFICPVLVQVVIFLKDNKKNSTPVTQTFFSISEDTLLFLIFLIWWTSQRKFRCLKK